MSDAPSPPIRSWADLVPTILAFRASPPRPDEDAPCRGGDDDDGAGMVAKRPLDSLSSGVDRPGAKPAGQRRLDGQDRHGLAPFIASPIFVMRGWWRVYAPVIVGLCAAATALPYVAVLALAGRRP